MSVNDETIETYNRFADKWLQNRSPILPEPFAKPLKNFLSHIEINTAPILEIGSGPGYTAEYAASLGYRFVPTDASVTFVDVMQKRGLNPIQLNIIYQSYRPMRFKGIWAGAVLHHMDDEEFNMALNNIFRGLLHGGWFGCTVRYGSEPLWNNKLGGRRYYNPQSSFTLYTKLTNVGFVHFEAGEFTDDRDEEWLWAIAQRPLDH